MPETFTQKMIREAGELAAGTAQKELKGSLTGYRRVSVTWLRLVARHFQELETKIHGLEKERDDAEELADNSMRELISDYMAGEDEGDFF